MLLSAKRKCILHYLLRRKVMSRLVKLFFAYMGLFAVVVGVSVQASAQKRNEREVRDIVRSLNSKIDDFRYTLNYQLKSSSADRQQISDVTNDLRSLQDKVNAFQTNFEQRRENRDDVSEIVDAVQNVDGFLTENPQNSRITTEWADVKTLVSRLSSNYGITPDWNDGGYSTPGSGSTQYPGAQASTASYGLSGTYELDNSRSESTDQIISETNVDQTQRQDLQDKLEAPEQIAIDIRGSQVTLASSKATPVTVIADGREKTERDSNGRTVRLKATLSGQQLTVSSLGGDTDYTITFLSQDNGRTLKVTRRITTEYLRQTVFADSIYNKTDSIAKLGIDSGGQSGNSSGAYSDNDAGNTGAYGTPPTAVPGRTGEYVVPNGTVITGLLESTIDTKVSENNDRFRLTVQSPDEFRGATIEGYLTGIGRSGRVSGSSNVTFNFQTIKLRNGQTYDFAGFLQSIKDQNGKVVKVDTEGTAKGDSQTKETVKRGGIGAGIGALIGAIAGGGKGAAIGAVIGGGAGAGSVIAQGRDDVQLMQGSTITVTSSSPIRGGSPQEN